MKKLRLLFSALALLLCSTSLLAHDFEVDGIYYQITSSTDLTVKVSYGGSSYSDYSNEYFGSVAIPETVTYDGNTYSVTSIGRFAFYNCYRLKSVTIPNSVTSIGERAFESCSKLTSVTIPNSVTSIGDRAFYGTAWYYNLPDGLVYINNVLYKYKGTLPSRTAIEIKEGTISISSSAFSDCSALESVTIPNSVTSIGGSAFYNCSGLESVTIPNSVTSIGEYAFYGCGLKSVTIPNSVTSIGGYAFYGCSGLSSVTIPNSVKSIGDGAFYGCSGLSSVTIPNSVTSIGDKTFYNCSGLKSVTIPNRVTSIGDYAFYNCFCLTSVTIPNRVRSIGEKAFAECSHLNDVYCFAEKVPSTESDALDSYVEYATLHVPAESIGDYKAAAPWSSFGKIVALAEEETGIEDIAVEDVNINNAPVYNLRGMKMQDVDNLPAGIYIKGGKKFIIK